MLLRIDRHIIRVPNLDSAVRYYRDVLGLTLARQEKHVASFRLADDSSELILHADPDQPEDAIYYLVDDVRDIFHRREELKLAFVSPPAQASRLLRQCRDQSPDNVRRKGPRKRCVELIGDLVEALRVRQAVALADVFS